MDKPTIIEGGFFEDDRGSLSFVNDFKFDKIERFYMISNSDTKPLRAWQGHKYDEKNFFCVQGSFKISFVLIDDWENPSKLLKVKSHIINAYESKIIHIPAGYANAILSLESNSKLISFSTLPLDEVKNDDVRFESNMWKIDE
jgi:dTDP-4-dehydrorhamnose 3,5-epimerase-like enzyme